MLSWNLKLSVATVKSIQESHISVENNKTLRKLHFLFCSCWRQRPVNKHNINYFLKLISTQWQWSSERICKLNTNDISWYRVTKLVISPWYFFWRNFIASITYLYLTLTLFPVMELMCQIDACSKIHYPLHENSFRITGPLKWFCHNKIFTINDDTDI